MDTLTVMVNLFLDLARMWSPVLGTIALVVVGTFGAKTVRTARRNAAIRAERVARANWLAPVIPFPVRHTDHVA